jgi:hypothetical protein
MSGVSYPPPNPYFSGINFNSSFFSTVVEYLTEAIANTKYLMLNGLNYMTGNLGIKRTPAVELDVNGKAIIHNGLGGTPVNGIYGGDGTRLILWPGAANDTAYAFGIAPTTLWYGVPSGAKHIFYTGIDERMRIKGDGNVGIGTNDPQTKLDVRGKINAEIPGGVTGTPTNGTYGGDGTRLILYPGSATTLAYQIGISGGRMWYAVPSGSTSHAFYAGTAEIMKVDSGGSISCTGNIYMGTDNNYPDIRLGSANGNNISIATVAGSFSTSALVNDMVIRSSNRLLLQSGMGKASIKIGTNNNIALGIDTPTTYPITIGSSLDGTATTLPTYAIAGVGAYIGNQTAGLTPNIVLGITNSTVFTTGFYLYSDERIKKDIKPLENSLDLINKINPISFKYIDYVQKGTINNYGVIAQEIEKIIPEVVNSHKDYIPNIYKNVDKYDNDLLRLYIKTDELSVGDNIKIYDINNKYHYKKIIEIAEDYIVIDEPIENYEEGTDVFIFGKEVDEVKNVNYEALFVINIKATQELHQRLRALEDIIKNLIK